MSTARWLEVSNDVSSAERHFAGALRRFPVEPEGDEEAHYEWSMAVMHMMQSGHTAAESALRRVLTLIGEDLPSGADWHATIIERCARPVPASRPAILSENLRAALDETRQFRHVAMHVYDRLDSRKAMFAIEAAQVVVERLRIEIDAFRIALDPPPPILATR